MQYEGHSNFEWFEVYILILRTKLIILFLCHKIDLKEKTPSRYLNSSARNIKNKKKAIFFKKYIKNYENLNLNGNLSASIIIPDKDIIPGAKTLSPAYIVFDNYEKILQWNRSLRFALAVCTLKDGFKDEI